MDAPASVASSGSRAASPSASGTASTTAELFRTTRAVMAPGAGARREAAGGEHLGAPERSPLPLARSVVGGPVERAEQRLRLLTPVVAEAARKLAQLLFADEQPREAHVDVRPHRVPKAAELG